MIKRLLNTMIRTARQIVVLIIGSTVVLLGVVMIVTPGSACIVIPLGLAILATEFVWARRLLRQMRDRTVNMARAAGLMRTPTNPDPPVAGKPDPSDPDPPTGS